MSENGARTVAADLIYLLSCAVNEEEPAAEICAAMDIDEVLDFAKKHMVAAAAAFALEQALPLPTAWRDAKGTVIRRQIIFEAERAKILKALEENGVWYVPLKGIIIKSCYPKPAMREMSDNDILCDPDKMDTVREIMFSLGYSGSRFGETNHDVYKKKAVSFEMHRSLFLPDKTPVLAEYYETVKDRLVKDEKNRFGYHFTDEDFYIHLVCHMYKHYVSAGVGLKALLDLYVYNSRKGDSLNRRYLSAEFDKLEIKAFEHEMRELAFKAFMLQPLSDNERDMLSYLIDSNSFGSYSTMIAHQLHNDDSVKAKLKYFLGRVFPDKNYLKGYYPTVYRHRILYPLLVAYRPFRGLVKKRKVLQSEFNSVREFKRTDSFDPINK